MATSLILVTVGLSSSVLHLGKPMRAWRAFSQWRTSWLSREGIFSLLVYVGFALVGVSLAIEHAGSTTDEVVGAVAMAWIVTSSIETVVCTAMIYASLKPIPAWRHRLVVPLYLAFSLQTGGWIAAALFDVADEPAWAQTVLKIGCGVATLALAAMKLKYWRDIDRIELPSREAATALEGIGKVATFERPHTEANYLTREMGFVLARKHSRKLRVIAVVLFAAIPLLALLMATLLPVTAVIALWVAAISALIGAFVERWLFFAEAKHMVMLYY
jgi:DMSO reductase anchor subunit